MKNRTFYAARKTCGTRAPESGDVARGETEIADLRSEISEELQEKKARSTAPSAPLRASNSGYATRRPTKIFWFSRRLHGACVVFVMLSHRFRGGLRCIVPDGTSPHHECAGSVRASDDPSAGDLLRNIPRDWDMELLALIRLYH